MAMIESRSPRSASFEGKVLTPGLNRNSLLELQRAFESRTPLVLLSEREPTLLQDAEHLLQILPQLLSDHSLSKNDLTSGLVVLRSSGSISRPAWIVHSQRCLRQAAILAAQSLSFDRNSLWRLTVPLNHVSGLGIFLRCQEAGAKLLLPNEEGQETHLSLVPTQLYRLLREKKLHSLNALECLLLGGSCLDASLRQACIKAGIQGVMSYGLSETAALIAHTIPGNYQDFSLPMNAGHLLPGWELRFSKDQEIQLRGPSLALARISHDGEFCQFFDGWFSTGDLGRLDESGRLLVEGRKGNLIISGGENIRAEEIEEALRKLPFVEKALVLPMDDEEFGQRPGAFVHWRGEAPTLDEVRETLEEHLPRYKHPHRLFEWPADFNDFKPSRQKFQVLMKSILADSK